MPRAPVRTQGGLPGIEPRNPTAQAVADARRTVDGRLRGSDDVPVSDGPGDLFSGRDRLGNLFGPARAPEAETPPPPPPAGAGAPDAAGPFADLVPEPRRATRAARGSGGRDTLRGPRAQEPSATFRAAVDRLLADQDGEAEAALFNADVGPIDLLWGRAGDPAKDYADGYGLAHILAKHPEVDPYALEDIVARAKKTGQHGNAVELDSEAHRALVKLDWNGARRRWLLTAYERSESGLARDAGRIGGDAPAGADSASALVGPPPTRGAQSDTSVPPAGQARETGTTPEPLTAAERATYERLDAKSRAEPERMSARDWERLGDLEDKIKGTPEPPTPRRTFSAEEKQRWADEHARVTGRKTDPTGDVDPDGGGAGTLYSNPFMVGIKRTARDIGLHP